MSEYTLAFEQYYIRLVIDLARYPVLSSVNVYTRDESHSYKMKRGFAIQMHRYVCIKSTQLRGEIMIEQEEYHTCN